jgi:hypothetical protein
MNPVADLIVNFQALVDQVPAFVQPFVVMLAAAIPFIEGEGAGPIGVVGGINPVVAAVAAMIGNFAAVVGVVTLTSRARTAVVTRSQGAGDLLVDERPEPEAKPRSKGRERFARWVVRFGVPGASILGPLAIPTHFTSAMLVASGTPKAWVLLWQGVAIVLWTTLITTLAWLALGALNV